MAKSMPLAVKSAASMRQQPPRDVDSPLPTVTLVPLTVANYRSVLPVCQYMAHRQRTQ